MASSQYSHVGSAFGARRPSAERRGSELMQTVVRNFLRSEVYRRRDFNCFRLNPLPYDCPNSIRLNFNNSVASGYWDVIRLSDDVLVYIVDNSYRSDFTIPYNARQDQAVFRFSLCGKMDIDADCLDSISLDGPCLSYFLTGRNSQVELNYCKGSDHRMITAYVSLRKIHKLLAPGNHHLHHKRIHSNANGDLQPQGCHPLPPEVRGAVIDIFSAQFFGPVRKMYVEAKVNELLCYALSYVVPHAEESSTSTIRPRDQERIREVYDILSERYLSPPDINVISRHVGLNRTVLRRYFKMIYGQTINEFCIGKRMADARFKLLNSDMNVTQISHHLGYEHASNFTTAFKKYYGIPPKELRKPMK